MRNGLLICLAVLALVGAWVGLSSLGPRDAPRYPFGGTVLHYNRLAGEWLALHSFPRPECQSRETAAGSLDTFRAGEVDGDVGEMYAWTDAQGERHYTDDLDEVPESLREGARVASLPKLEVYRGEYSRVRASIEAVKAVPPRRSAPAAGKVKAVVYSAEWCGACKSTKALLADLGVVVEERDIDKDPRALAELIGIAGKDAAIPVTLIGKKAVGGFDEPALRAAVAAARPGR